MEYKKGDVFYKYDKYKYRLVKLEIEDIVYKLSNGTICGRKYVNDEEVKHALDHDEIYLNDQEYKKRKIEEKKEKIKKLQEEIKKMGGNINE